jgi:NAD(P)H-dependent FMN reductase
VAPKLHVVICSTRPSRLGPVVAKWFEGKAREHAAFDVELVDIGDFNLPVFDEPHHPRMQKYEHEHTRKWSAKVSEADAFVFVTPEYNYGPPPSLLNALNYLVVEWNYKPAALVSYGGVSGGLRAAQMIKLTLTTLKMMPMTEGVMIPMFTQNIENGEFRSNELIDASIKPMLDELSRWTNALKPLRG